LYYRPNFGVIIKQNSQWIQDFEFVDVPEQSRIQMPESGIQENHE